MNNRGKKKGETGRKLCKVRLGKKNEMRNLEVFILKIYATEIGLRHPPVILLYWFVAAPGLFWAALVAHSDKNG